MEFKNEKPAVEFSLPDRITVRQQLQYLSAATMAGASTIEARWNAAKQVIQDWKCKVVPDMNIDLAEVDDRDITGVVVWVSWQVYKHMLSLDELPKN